MHETRDEIQNFASRLANTQDFKFAREPRYSCRECRDNGWVSIWTPSTIRSAIDDPDRTKWRTCVVLCSCRAADRNAVEFRTGERIGKPLPIFGEKAWHINAKSPTAKADAATYVHRPENYNEAFAGMDAS